MVQPACAEGAARRLRTGARLHDRSALWLGAVGKHAAGARPAIQGHRPSECGVSAADSSQLYRQGKASRRGVFAGTGSSNHRRRRRTGRAFGHSSHFGNHHRTHVVEVDSVLPRFACTDESVEQCGAVGIAHEAFSAHARVLLAGRPHGARHARRSRSGDDSDAECVRGFCYYRCRDPRDSREKV